MKLRFPTWSLALILVSAGCHPAETPSSDDATPKRQVVTFDGQIDPKFVGDWVAPNDVSSLDLKKDGTVTIGVSSRGNKSSLPGQWLVDQSNLILKYTVGNHPEVVIKYSAKLDGKTLTLTSSGGRLKTVYTEK